MPKNKYKLLVTDIDGTLEGKSGTIAPEDAAALIQAQKQGIALAVSTGRIAAACRDVFAQLHLNTGCHIFCDGALVSNINGSSGIFQQSLEDEIVRETIDFALAHNIYLELATGTEYFTERITKATRIHTKILNMEPKVGKLTALKGQKGFIKENLIKTEPRDEEGINLFWEHFTGRVNISRVKIPRFPGVDFINVVNRHVSKGVATAKLAEYMGFSLEQVVALGDGMNDLSVIQAVGLGIAMGSAPEELKSAADYVTYDAEHNGVAHAVKKFLLD